MTAPTKEIAVLLNSIGGRLYVIDRIELDEGGREVAIEARASPYEMEFGTPVQQLIRLGSEAACRELVAELTRIFREQSSRRFALEQEFSRKKTEAVRLAREKAGIS